MRFLLLMSLGLMLSCSPNKGEKIADKPISEMSDDELRAYADTLAHRFIIADGHVDLPYRMNVAGFMIKKEVMDVSVETTGNFDYPKSRKGGLDAPFMSIYVPSRYQVSGGAKELADSLINLTQKLTVTFPNLFASANSPQEVAANFEKGLISLPMGMENGAPIENDLANVAYFYNRGIRYITLTHATDNQICDSSYDDTRTWNGLSPFGRDVVKEMNRVGIMVDISHVSDSTFYQVMDMTDVPVIASHSSCRHFTPDFERNMSDDMIKRLGAEGGVICINFGSTFLSKESQDKFDQLDEHLTNYKAENNLTNEDSAYQAYSKQYALELGVFEDVNKVVDHIDHVVKLTSIDNVGFGSDFDGVGDSLPNGLKDVSMFPNVIYEMLKRGYSPEDIEKVCSKNMFRVWNAVATAARPK
jgi:membrane dipeptidase